MQHRKILFSKTCLTTDADKKHELFLIVVFSDSNYSKNTQIKKSNNPILSGHYQHLALAKAAETTSHWCFILSHLA